MYTTLVNAGPDDFVLVSKHSYQMDTFDFQTVPALTARQNKMAYRYDVFGASGDFVDDKGEAHYQIQGSGSTFQVWARTHASDDDHPMRADLDFDGFGTRDVQRGNKYEYKDRGSYQAINLVVAGSQKYGYWTSIDPPIGWMCSIRDVIGDRKLKHVCLLGSHDAGMSTLNGQTERECSPPLSVRCGAGGRSALSSVHSSCQPGERRNTRMEYWCPTQSWIPLFRC